MIKVYYPSGGKHYLLHWKTHNDGAHVALARTQEALDKIANRIIKQYAANSNEYLTLLQMSKVDIVSPPQSFIDLAGKTRYQKQVKDFEDLACSIVGRAFRENKLPLPSSFVTCPEKHRSEWDSCYDHEIDVQLCFYCTRLTIPAVEFYEKYHAAWEEKNPPHTPSKQYPQPKENMARMVAEADELWYAGADFGHHSHGVVIEKVDLENNSRILTDDALFFFLKLEEISASKYNQAIKSAKEENAKFEKRRLATMKKEAKTRAEKELLNLIEIFC